VTFSCVVRHTLPHTEREAVASLVYFFGRSKGKEAITGVSGRGERPRLAGGSLNSGVVGRSGTEDCPLLKHRYWSQ
jgi:hypothetical protein